MNYSTILGITIGTLAVFVIVFIGLAIYFPIIPDFFPFFKTPPPVTKTFSPKDLEEMREELRKESIPIIPVSQTSTSELTELREELKTERTKSSQPSEEELKKMRDELRSQQK